MSYLVIPLERASLDAALISSGVSSSYLKLLCGSMRVRASTGLFTKRKEAILHTDTGRWLSGCPDKQ